MGLGILTLTFLVYMPALRGPFIWDDGIVLTDNPIVKASNGLYFAWFSTLHGDYIPLTMTSFWLEWRLWGASPIGYRVVNVLLHALCAILLWRILPKAKVPGAFFAAVLFAVHPVAVTSVAWVAERKNTLSLLFYLLSILFFLRAEERVGGKMRGMESRFAFYRSHWYWLALVAFFLGLASKQSVVVLPAVLLLMLWWMRGRIAFGDITKVSPFFALTILASAMAIWVQQRAITVELPHTDSLVTRLLGGTWAAWFYLSKAIVPVGLSIIYPRWQIDPSAVRNWLPATGWVLLLFLVWRYRQSWGRSLFFALAYLIITLSPVLGLFDMIYFAFSRVGDHLQYIGLVGSVALISAVLHNFGTRIALLKRGRCGTAIPSLMVAAVFGVLGWQRAALFGSPEALWRDALKKNPDSYAVHQNLGSILDDLGRLDEAITHLREATRLNPLGADAMNNLGYVYHRKGDLKAAETNYVAALQVSPSHSDANANLGVLLLDRGELDAAREHFIRALATRPTLATARYSIARLLMMQAKFDEAVPQLQLAVDNKADFAPAQNDLRVLGSLKLQWEGKPASVLNEAAIEFAAQKQYINALFLLHLALQTRENTAATYRNMASVCAIVGNPASAIHFNRLALQQEPESPQALNNLAWLLVTQPNSSVNHRNEALSLAKAAVALSNEQDPQLMDTLSVCHASLADFDQAIAIAAKARAAALVTGQTNLVAKLDRRLTAFSRKRLEFE